MKLFNRELSWLSFNERVLQEAMDVRVPLVERMRFLGIYSNNMDEFFRVRVANIRRLIQVGDKKVDGFEGTAKELYSEIRDVVLAQQKKFEKIYSGLLSELESHNIFKMDENSVNKEQQIELHDFFNIKLKHEIVPIILDANTPFPRLKDYSIYLAVKMVSNLTDNTQYALIQIPNEFPRFYRFRDSDKKTFIMLDDIIRLHLRNIFSIFEFDSIEAHTFKFTRDAELNLDDDISGSFIEKITKSLKDRRKGEPVRFVYDQDMSQDLLDYLTKSLNLKRGMNKIPGGKYHNFKDFTSFPTFEHPEFLYEPRPPHIHKELEDKRSLIKVIFEKDVLLHFPYQRFDYVVDLLREAAIDPKVTTIKINVYRVANHSQVMNALLTAASNGKDVTVVMELQARFDEANNLYWSNRLKENHVKVLYGLPDLKIHSKLMQITRRSKGKDALISYIGTGNFNEKTSRIYTDLGFITADDRISREVKKVFHLIENHFNRGLFRELMVSPFNTRRKIIGLIDNEIAFAKKKKKGLIRLKMNNLVDKTMIFKLYEASKAGVKIELIIRGVCSLVAGVKGQSENIKVISTVDRYLEHARFMIFGNNGNPVYYLTSADWMERNLDKRIEVGCPIYCAELQRELDLIFNYQWKGNNKARIIDEKQSNKYRKMGNDASFHSQEELYKHYTIHPVE
jgi:polyphosphate kinase